MEAISFENNKIRRKWHKREWFFSIIDVIARLTESSIPKRYWADLKSKLEEEGFEGYDNIVRLKLIAEDGKLRETDCTDTQGIFRIIQGVPSKKAEPFKRWLAKVGYERIQEIENPELAQERMKKLYEQKGYSKGWIDKRVRGIAVRQDLTDEWKSRGVGQRQEFAILTNEIAKATFGVSIKKHKQIKQIDKENLRDYMTDLELIFSMLGEASTTEIKKEKNIKGMDQALIAAKLGGDIAGKARTELEETTGKQVTTSHNPLSEESIKKAANKIKKEIR